MSTTFLNKITQNVGVIPTEVLATVQTGTYTVIGLNLANTTKSMIQVSVQLFSYAANMDGTSDKTNVLGQAYIMKNIMMAPQSSLKVITNSEKLILPGNNSVVVTSNTPNSIDSIASYVAIA